MGIKGSFVCNYKLILLKIFAIPILIYFISPMVLFALAMEDLSVKLHLYQRLPGQELSKKPQNR